MMSNRRLRRERRRPKPEPSTVFVVTMDEVMADLVFGTGESA
jgi:hypothetical protein